MNDTLPPLLAVGRTAEIFAWQEGRVLKLYRDWCPSNWVEEEAAIAAIVTQAGIPAPRAFEIVEVAGRRGLIYERIDGLSMLLEMLRQPLKIAAFGRMLADLHLEMHRQSAADLPLQSEMVGGAIYNAKLLSDAQRAAALDALRRLPPGDRLCHNDFHPENVLISAKGPLVIDWMTARRGNPWADVARTHLLISIGRPLDTNPLKLLLLLVARSVFVNAYHRRYREVKPDPEGQLQAWIPVMAAARLNENIKEETAALLAIVNKAF